MRTHRRIAAAFSAAALTTAMSACGIGSSDYCEALSGEDNSAGQVYLPYIATEPPADWAQPRLDLLDEAGAPDDEDLEDELETYRAYLEDMSEMDAGQENDAMMLKADDPEIGKAQDALFEDWNTNCEG